MAVAVCMVVYVPVVLPVMIILLVKDVAMLGGGTYLIKNGMTPPAAKWYGKLGTILFYISVCSIVFLKAAFDYENYVLDFVLLAITAVAMIFALFKYGGIFFSMIKEHKAEQNNLCKNDPRH
ncbi:MAG: hypothetical protein LUF33_06915 [Clostridiales bacterium]|nr:hypothetical protein [Clostridiales bacterium]